jgi:hypothetical protein
MLQKTSKEKNITFLDKFLNEKKPEADTQEQPVQDKKNEAPLKAAQKLDNSNMITRGGKVMSARTGVISDTGGPSKQLHSTTSNSIWDPNTIDTLKESKDNREKTEDEVAEIKRLRKGMEKGRIDEMVESIKQTDTRKTSSVAGMTSYRGSSYQKPRNNMSIFDSGDFERVPEQTGGEKISERARKPKEKDATWQKTNTTKSLNKSLDKLFNSQDK